MSQQMITTINRIVGAYLTQQGYTDSLAAFEKETSLSIDSSAPPRPDLRELVQEYLAKEKASLAIPPPPIEEELKKLQLTARIPDQIAQTIKEATNVLSVNDCVLPKRSWNSTQGRFVAEFIPCVVIASVDRTIKFLAQQSDFATIDEYTFASPVLSLAFSPASRRHVVVATMEGSLSLIDLVTRTVLQKISPHSKYIVKVVWSNNGRFVASAGYDKFIKVYEVVEGAGEQETNALVDGEEEDELASTKLISLVERERILTRTNPEGLAFLPTGSLVYSCREDHMLHYVSMPGDEEKASVTTDRFGEDGTAFKLSGYNLNPNGDAFVSFSILNILIHPTLPLLALQTSTENSRILLYPFHSASRLTTLYTCAEQSEWCTPRMAFFPNGEGVCVTSEDGILRVIDMSGRLLASIGVHGAASPPEDDGGDVEGRSERVRARRALLAGSSVVKDVAVIEQDGELVFVSGGFDRTVRVVRVAH